MTLVATTPAPKVLVIIVNWNKKTMLEQLLTMLPDSTRNYDVDVLVVDNASTDGSQQMVREKFPNVRLLEHTKNIGGTGGFNAGMRWGMEAADRDYDFFWLLDNDVTLFPDSLSGLMTAIEALPHTAVAGSAILIMDKPDMVQECGSDINWRRGTLMSRGVGPFDKLEPNAIWQVDYVAACSLLVRTLAIREVGIWDPAYFLYWDDIDFGLRFNRAGWRVVSTTASRVCHASYNDRRAQQGINNFYLCVRNPLYCLHRFTVGKWWQPLMLFRLFSGFLRTANNYASTGDYRKAEACRRGIRDFMEMRFGAPPDDLCKNIEDDSKFWHTTLPADVDPANIRKIMLLSDDTPELTISIEKRLEELFPGVAVTIFVFSELCSFPPDKTNIAHIYLNTFPRRLRVHIAALSYDAVAVVHSASHLFAEKLAPRLFVFREDLTFFTARRSALRVLRRILERPVIWAQALRLTLATLIVHRPAKVDYFTFYPYTRPIYTCQPGEDWAAWKPAARRGLLYRTLRAIGAIICLPFAILWMLIPLLMMPVIGAIDRRDGKGRSPKRLQPTAYTPNVKREPQGNERKN